MIRLNGLGYALETEEEVRIQKDEGLVRLPCLTCIRPRCSELVSQVPWTPIHVMGMTTSVLSMRVLMPHNNYQ